MKQKLTEQIERIKDLNKIFNEQNYNDAYGPTNLGTHGYRSGLGINSNTDYLSDIGAVKRKDKPKIDGRTSPNRKYGNFDINIKSDRRLIAKRLAKRMNTKSATPETIENIKRVLNVPNNKDIERQDILNCRFTSLDLKNVFDIEVAYFLLLEGEFIASNGIHLSKTFMELIDDSNSQKIKFKKQNHMQLDEFTDFMLKNYDKMEDEAFDVIRDKQIARKIARKISKK